MTLLLPTDFVLRRGKSRRLEHTIRDGDGNEVNISALVGSAITWRIALTKGGANLFEYTIGSGIAITDGANGKCEVTVASTDTTGLTADTIYYWETVVTIGTDIVTVAEGYIKIVEPIS